VAPLRAENDGPRAWPDDALEQRAAAEHGYTRLDEADALHVVAAEFAAVATAPYTGAMDEHDEVRRHLDTLGVPYEIIDCDPALADTAAFCATYGYPLEDSANTIVVAGKADPPRYAACVVLAPTRLDVNRTVRNRLGVRKASFAAPEDTRALTGMELGGVTVFGLPHDLPIWVDSRVMDRERVILGGGSRSYKIAAPPAILLALPHVEVVDGLATGPQGT
jgi:prolyl-tRNA editing enzyme YbaK/EbsC (Cys-tRNA(Pro) deacylase)